MTEKNEERPYKAIGDRLKFLREQWQQTIKEVSGTLEIDEATLKEIESGIALPEYEVLDMFISHYLLTEDQAEDLRQLVENQIQKNSNLNDPFASNNIEEMLAKQLVMYMPIDNRTVYTDGMNANVNDHGVTLQFLQQNSNSKQPTVVSRVGMSREHAEKIVEVLSHTLNQYYKNKSQKRLPKPENTDENQN